MRSTQLSFALLSSSLAPLANAAVTRLNKRAEPEDIEGGWEYQGCFVDVGRTLTGPSRYSPDMTNEMCTSWCAARQYAYAGTEWYEECFCGNALSVGGVIANELDCNTPCAGNSSQPCGGGNRLTLYFNDNIQAPGVNPGVGQWESLGCYTGGTGGRALSHTVGDVPTSEMTIAKCLEACEDADYILAGVEYGGECYCGNTINNEGEPAVDGCNMLCNGNSSEYCGGPNRLNLYNFNDEFEPSSTSISTPPPTASSLPASSGASSSEEVSSESPAVTSDPVESTPESSAPAPTSSEEDESPLSLSSSDEPSSTSGGDNGPDDGPAATGSATASSAAATPTGPHHPASVGNYNWHGCRTEATGMRALSGDFFASDEIMTLEACQTFCSRFRYFGTEYARECFCGNSFNTGSVAAPESECDMICVGNPLQFCGAGNRLSVYERDGSSGPDPSGDDGAATVSSSAASSGTATPSSTPRPVPTGLPEGWSDYGCWIDGVAGRILGHQAPDDSALTLAKCATYCSDNGYSISGAQYSYQCFCGNAIVNSGAEASSPSQCNTACSGDSSQMCGGPDRMTIIADGPPVVQGPPVPQEGGLNGDWTYQGCVEDNVNEIRTFYWQTIMAGDMTANKCLDLCAEFGYHAAGLEYGEECFCGDPANIDVRSDVSFRPESECNIVCAGNGSSICGGGSRMTTYFWTGDPLYSWDFPQDPAIAGSYEFLIGGVVIPLITMESITGKVTFLEKWGTGPPNSTGAYELDLSLVPDINRAWREMHVRTDIFCAAGVTLPDKVGRQLNVGGWSGISTEGVRLYWPDGEPGVNGTNDWEEDASRLSLQDGRWYPTAAIMANGSIFVIGGEEGSNGAAVPTIEVLPYTGTAPLYMDWLERTDPNNLYPYVAILPSEDIFVAYWNEARILDKTTFDTTVVLPDIPGAVNNPMGGRTYPLEGTGVLLPQHAPYTDPLGILICGGSTEGAAYALDNCVTIYPEAAEPEWVIERMPSRRVISCMAPLPDGTYLINNGAQHGVAGFGLANDPNYNAVLYDPKKPIGSRMTVMANTTIARMYHSESITLLDGRVLVSGSDPDDGVHPQEYRVEVFNPPYLTSGAARPTFTLENRDWSYGATVTFTLGGAPVNGDIEVSLLGSVSSTHGNSMGTRTIFPAVSCSGTTCTVTAPPSAGICPPGWFQFFVLDGGIPAVGVYVRIGGDPAELGNWPDLEGFSTPGM